MKTQNETNILQGLITNGMNLDAQVSVLFEVVNNVLDEGAVRARTVKFKLQKYTKSNNAFERLYALNKIVSDGKGIKAVPTSANVHEALENTYGWISEELARRYIQNKIESQVEQALMEKQEKYVDEMRLGIIRKQKGPENAKTLKKYAKFQVLDSRTPNKNIMSLLRPSKFNEVIGQERAVKSLLSKMASPYPQHIILYGAQG